MNECIKEIKVQTDVYCDQNYPDASEAEYCLLWEEKFAELIVRKCINQVSDLMDYTEYTDSHFNAVELKALRDARRVIQEHFGVKNES